MEHWHKYKNYKKVENLDGSYTYIIIVNGIEVEVNKEIYRAYATAGRKMKYIERDLKRDRILQDANGRAVKDENGLSITLPEREISLEKLIDEDWDFPDDEPLLEDVVIHKNEIEQLRFYLKLLNDDERALIKALFFEGLTEQEYAEMLGVKQQSVNERKLRILKKIKNLWNQPC